ncbi:MAG: hypothetical protein ABIN00_02105 [candidate division WOR-3 bacterium]
MLVNNFIISILIIFALLINFIILYDKKGYVISFIVLLNIYSLIVFFLNNDIISILFVLFNSFLTSILVIKFINGIETKK